MSVSISVIIPVYNQEVYLAEAVESVLAQTYTDFELILVDDGSTDSTPQLIKEYALKDSRIVPLFFTNGGKAVAINRAVTYAKGQFCAFMDHDDAMMPDRLEKQIAFHLANPEVAATSAHCYYIDDKSNIGGIQRYNGLKNEAECKQVIDEGKLVLCAFTALMISKAVFQSIGGLNQAYWPCDDFEFTNRILEQGHLLIIIQEPLMKYRVHSASESISKQWNTFEYTDFTSTNIRLRRAGQPEISFETFRKNFKARPWKEKWQFKSHGYAVIYLKKANFSLHSKRYLRFFYEIGLASLLDIKYIIATIKKRKYYSSAD